MPSHSLAPGLAHGTGNGKSTLMSNAGPLRIRILPPGSERPGRNAAPATPLRALGDASASLGLGGDRPTLDIVLPSCTRTETRWIVDRVIRNLGASMPYEGILLEVADGVDEDTAEALALDLAERANGSLEIEGRSSVGARVARVRPYLDLFRRWVDEDPSTRTSHAIAADAKALADAHSHVVVEVLDEEPLREKGLRLLLAVGAGSELSPPRLVMAHYRPPGTEGQAPLMLLGKGITFDTGGINVKAYESFVSMMKNDMAGAALAFALFKSLVEGEHPRPVSLVLPTCENAIGPRSMRPGAIVESYRGHRVRIDHTDAEGRLILADGLAYASDQLEPEQILCFATLTTAALISYGPFATPVHFAGAELEQSLAAAGEACGEDLHFFPERIWHMEANRDKEADLRNTARLPGNAVRGAGSRNAAHFLRHFSERPLCHFDIFASTWNWSGEAPGAGYGATGAPLRTLLRAIRG